MDPDRALGPAEPAPPHANAPVAVAVGVVHGAAARRVLGVLPAVARRAPRRVVGYFAGFIAATVLTMGAFAMLWGEVTGIAGKRGGRATERTLAFVSSAACVIVGVAFVALTLAGFEPD